MKNVISSIIFASISLYHANGHCTVCPPVKPYHPMHFAHFTCGKESDKGKKFYVAACNNETPLSSINIITQAGEQFVCEETSNPICAEIDIKGQPLHADKTK